LAAYNAGIGHVLDAMALAEYGIRLDYWNNEMLIVRSFVLSATSTLIIVYIFSQT
jgi:hypothetical protein